MRLPKFEYFAPRTLEEALDLLAEKGDSARILAGGTDLLIRMKQGLLKPQAIIGLEGIQTLKAIGFQPKVGLTIGAMARLVDVTSHPAIRKHYPAVAYAAQETANVQVRNMGRWRETSATPPLPRTTPPPSWPWARKSPWPARPAKDACPWTGSSKDRG